MPMETPVTPFFFSSRRRHTRYIGDWSSTCALPIFGVAGQDAEYLAAATQAYKTGARKDESMKGPVAGLDEQVMKDIAAYYAAQQPQPLNVRRPLTLAEWTER